jgi:hypothetical protein
LQLDGVMKYMMTRRKSINIRAVHALMCGALAVAMFQVAPLNVAMAVNCDGCSEFRTDRDSAGVWLRDGDPREETPTTKRGTLNTVTIGRTYNDLLSIDADYNGLFFDTLVFSGDTNAAGNGISQNQVIHACTLWTTINSVPSSGNDTLVFDLYEITEGWNENNVNAVSWNFKVISTAWTEPGGAASLYQDSGFALSRIAADTVLVFTYTSSGFTLWDTVLVSSNDSIPIPIDSTTANRIYIGLGYGIALKRDASFPTESRSYKFSSTENVSSNHRPQFQWVYESLDDKVIMVLGDTTAPAADTLIKNYIEDSLRNSRGGGYVVTYLDDLQAHNQRTNQPWWDSVHTSLVVWSSSTSGSYHITDIDVPIMLMNGFAVSSFNLGSGVANATATKRWLNQRNHWITAPYPGDTILPIHGSNLTVRQVLEATNGDLQNLIWSAQSTGPDTACVVVVDSGAMLHDSTTAAPNRRVYNGFTNPELWTWAHGWDLLFTRMFYFLVDDTTNAAVRNRVKVGDELLASTWFEIGSCDMATISGSATIRPGYDISHVGGLLRYDSLAKYIGAAPAGSTIVIDSVDFDMYLTPTNAYNIQGADSSFDMRLYVTEIRRTVPFNEGTSSYDGLTCGTGDTASTTNHWVNRYSPAYPSTSRHLWSASYGDNIDDSAWKSPAARDTTADIYQWRAGDTVRVNKSATPPDSWTDFPINEEWFQGIVDGGANLGFAIGQDTLYDTSNCELNYRGRAELPTTDNAPRLTIWWSYTEALMSSTTRRRRILQ